MPDNRITLSFEDVRIDAEPEVIGTLFKQLLDDEKMRAQFKESPAEFLAAAGIQVSPEAAKNITKENLDALLAELSTEERDDLNQLCVLIGVRVGLRPGTRPGVGVGTRVAVRSRITVTAAIAAGPAPGVRVSPSPRER